MLLNNYFTPKNIPQREAREAMTEQAKSAPYYHAKQLEDIIGNIERSDGSSHQIRYKIISDKNWEPWAVGVGGSSRTRIGSLGR